MIDGHNVFETPEGELYGYIHAQLYAALPIKLEGEGVYTTYHKRGETVYAVAVNHSASAAEIRIISDEYEPICVHYGACDRVEPWSASVIELKRKSNYF